MIGKDMSTALQNLEDKLIKEEEASAIWLYLDLSYCSHLPKLINDLGFVLHHSKYIKHENPENHHQHETSKRPEFVLNKWLLKDRPSAIPHYSSHTLGVGGVVLHPDNTRILLIQEKI